MKKQWNLGALFATTALALLLSTVAIAQPDYRADRISTQGQITSITREGSQYRVELNHGSYTYYVPVSTIRNRDIRVGDQVRLGGVVTGDTVTTDYIAFAGEPAYTTDPSYRAVPFGSTGWMSGTVMSVNRHLNFVTMRDDATGLPVKVDVRHMDTRHSVNVWHTRPGDHISVNGSWENRNTFQAGRVQY